MVEKTFVLYYIAREERGVNSSLTSDVGRYIQDLNILAINKPSTIYVFHRTRLRCHSCTPRIFDIPYYCFKLSKLILAVCGCCCCFCCCCCGGGGGCYLATGFELHTREYRTYVSSSNKSCSEYCTATMLQQQWRCTAVVHGCRY